MLRYVEDIVDKELSRATESLSEHLVPEDTATDTLRQPGHTKKIATR